ncbi:hypothetical protein FH972_004643 [Carpinus fangiana]|uniref:Uncharacterized protein n=1 Tax=Carpinus fangiana TaxID=176857 RepID=A0A5N6QNN3_9ROSI|nr:hypothetical protein FH972_004643 [Carpinus fangiana]
MPRQPTHTLLAEVMGTQCIAKAQQHNDDYFYMSNTSQSLQFTQRICTRMD